MTFDEVLNFPYIIPIISSFITPGRNLAFHTKSLTLLLHEALHFSLYFHSYDNFDFNLGSINILANFMFNASITKKIFVIFNRFAFETKLLNLHLFRTFINFVYSSVQLLLYLILFSTFTIVRSQIAVLN